MTLDNGCAGRTCNPDLPECSTPQLCSMQELAAGELIGSDEDLTLSVQRKCHVIMPNDEVAVGEDMLYIAQPEVR